MQIAIQPVEDVGAELEALADEVAAFAIVPARLEHREELLRVPRIDLGVQLVVDQLFFGHPALADDGPADDGRDVGEDAFDDAGSGARW